MKTKDLFQIVVDAQYYREMSYDGNKYGLNLEEAIDKAIDEKRMWDDKLTASPAERELALFLIRNAWNEVQDWAKE